MSVPVIERLRPLGIGVVLALYPSDPTLAQELQRAPSIPGMVAPDAAAAITIGYATPGARAAIDLNGATGPWWYRARQIRTSATEGPWTHWVGPVTPAPIPYQIPNVPKLRAPVVQAAWERESSTTAELTLTISDLDRLVTAVRFNKRQGSEAADTFTGWVTTWDSTTGTIGTDGTLIFEEDVLVEAGQESIIQWEVDFVDEDGNTQTVAGAQTSQNADEDETTVYWDAVDANPDDETVPVDKSNGDLRNRTAGSRGYSIGARLPPGVVITEVAANLYRQDTNGTARLQFIEKWEAGDVVSTVVNGNYDHATTAWDIVSSGALSITVVATRKYTFRIALDNDAGAAADERCLWVRATYTRKSQAQRL